MNESWNALIIGEVVERFGVSEWQLRYWDSTGILVPARVGNRRVYFREHQEQLALIIERMKQGYRPGQIRLLAEQQGLLQTKSVSMTKMLANMVSTATRGDVILEPLDPSDPSSYNTVYRRLERIAKRLKKEFQIRRSADGRNLELIIKS